MTLKVNVKTTPQLEIKPCTFVPLQPCHSDYEESNLVTRVYVMFETLVSSLEIYRGWGGQTTFKKEHYYENQGMDPRKMLSNI